MSRRKCPGKEDGCEVAKGAGSLASQDQWGDIAKKGSLVCKGMKEPSALISEKVFRAQETAETGTFWKVHGRKW